jgi:hypothetical protein
VPCVSRCTVSDRTLAILHRMSNMPVAGYKGAFATWCRLLARRRDGAITLRTRASLGLLIAFGCMAAAVSAYALQNVSVLGETAASSVILFLVVVAGGVTAGTVPSTLEIRLDCQGLVVRGLWDMRRYLWQEIGSGFWVTGPDAKPRVAFIWSPSVIAEPPSCQFLDVTDFRMSAAEIAAMLNGQWRAYYLLE